MYDLSRDPDETRNLYAADRSLALAYRERLGAVRSRFQPQQTAKPAALSPDVVAKLSSLGYVALSGSQSAPAESGLDPKDRIAEYEQYGRAIVLASSGRVVESSELLKQLLKKDPGLTDVHISLGLSQQKQHQHNEAIQHFRVDAVVAVAEQGLTREFQKDTFILCRLGHGAVFLAAGKTAVL